MEEIPTLVEADPEALQSLLVRLGRLTPGLLSEQLVLFIGELVDPVDDPTFGRGRRSSSSQQRYSPS